MRKLFLIPARGGSKGLPGKNILPLIGKPLIQYSIEAALSVKSIDDVVCVSTDSREIQSISSQLGAESPFIRPIEFSTDEAGSEVVIKHAIQWYIENRNKRFDLIVLLQPTSPLRSAEHIREAISCMTAKHEMILSVTHTKANPYFTLVKERDVDYIDRFIKSEVVRRQDCPNVYQINGAIYIIRTSTLFTKGLANLSQVGMYLMPEKFSIDIDTSFDLEMAEYILLKE